MLGKICLTFAVTITVIWIISLTLVVAGGAVWALQKLGGM